MRSAIVDGRFLARGAGVARLKAELRSLGIEASETTNLVVEELVRDVRRAQVAAKSYADRWFKKAEGATVREAADVANAATRGSLKRTAVTESSEAFNSGRGRAVRLVSQRVLYRVWDATLDRRTCSTCEGADGSVVGARESFPYGEPGGVHPFCRCSSTILVSTETREAIDIEAA